MKSILSFIVLAFLPLSVYSQSTEWLVKPDRYSEITYFAPGMYKVMQNGKVGIISLKGQTILEPIYDAVNLFYEGRTVFVNKAENEWQVKGVLGEDGTVYYTDNTFFLLPNYMFYSEGFLPVKDSRGMYGYLNEEAKIAFPFITEKIHPFSEGLASVGEGETFHWITTDGTEILPKLSNGGTPYGGTNLSNGILYLYDEDGIWFTLNSAGVTEGTSSKVQFVDYLYRRANSQNDVNVPYSKYTQSDPDKTWQPKQSASKWSYVSNSGKLLMPFEFDSVEPFYDGVAIAGIAGKYGLLRIVEDQSTFYIRTPRKQHIFSKGIACNCNFILYVPEKWRNQNITVIIRDSETGESIPIRNIHNNEYSFSYHPDEKKNHEEKFFNVEVCHNGVQLWEGKTNFNFIQRIKLTTRISVNNATANVNDLCSVTAVIKNPSPVAITTTVTLTGGGNSAQFNKKTVNMTIPANSSRSINSSFVIRKVEMNGWCAVSTTDGTSDRKSNLQFRPNF